jgi:UDP-N-acetyl-D-glucosamine dehydrogenase
MGCVKAGHTCVIRAMPGTSVLAPLTLRDGGGSLCRRQRRAVTMTQDWPSQGSEASRSAAATLAARIEARSATVGVIGLGHVGLPLALTVAGAGYRVLGFEIDPVKVVSLNEGRSYISHIDANLVRAPRDADRLEATGDFERLDEPDIILICVPTPLDWHREPDLRYITDTATAIARRMRLGQLVVLESTTYPGTTSGLVKPILATSGLLCGQDIFLAYSPEREDPGNHAFGTAAIPKVVAGEDDAALRLVLAFYDSFTPRAVPVSSTATAEAVKLTENIFRAVNIALMNELKVVYDAMGIDVWEVIDAAKTKPFGFMPFYPGPGLGGHCIPIDPFYLAWKAREFGVSTRFIELAGEVKTLMPRFVVERLALALDRQTGRELRGASVLLLGMAYKKNVADLRESPALVILQALRDRGAAVDYHDPHIAEIPPMREHGGLAGLRSVPLDAAMLAQYDAVLVVTDHDGVDYRAVVESARLVVDTRNACAKAGVSGPHVVKS